MSRIGVAESAWVTRQTWWYPASHRDCCRSRYLGHVPTFSLEVERNVPAHQDLADQLPEYLVADT